MSNSTTTLAAKIEAMTTERIKDLLNVMNMKKTEFWSKDEITVETALIFELYARDEEEFVEAHDASAK